MKNGFTGIEIMMVLLLVTILGGAVFMSDKEDKQYKRLMEQCLKVKPEFECVGILKNNSTTKIYTKY